ncbi:anhydro-N-acetylmuramic acid kinase [Nocardia sp. CA-135953]|uniref:anhydro-N-acetylmuramic acid kinase n=1 Tax=Nocardia sp. CA-135953 TaxID=3239978 RepID=UPI003D999DE0
MTALTARTIADALPPLCPTEVIASGGGTHNPSLMAMLGAHLGVTKLRTSDELGLPSAAKEATAFAVLGFLTAHALAGSHPACTGASRAAVLGSTTPGAAGLALPDVPTSVPRRLTVTR